MTQYNPPPPGYNPPGYPPPPPGSVPPQPPYQPPPGYPPPGGMPPGMQHYPPGYGPKQSNGAAIASLICGIIGCLVITPFLAIIFGIVGLRKASNPRVGGKAMSIIGILLGLAWLAIAGLSWGAIMALIHGTAPQRQLAHDYIRDLSAGDVSTAMGNTASGVSQAEVQQWSQKAQGLGNFVDTTVIGIFAQSGPGGSKTTLTGIAKFSTQPHAFTMILVKENGQWKVERLDFQ